MLKWLQTKLCQLKVWLYDFFGWATTPEFPECMGRYSTSTKEAIISGNLSDLHLNEMYVSYTANVHTSDIESLYVAFSKRSLAVFPEVVVVQSELCLKETPAYLSTSKPALAIAHLLSKGSVNLADVPEWMVRDIAFNVCSLHKCGIDDTLTGEALKEAVVAMFNAILANGANKHNIADADTAGEV